MKFRFNNRGGQVLVEYLLLMTIAIGCATLLTQQLISRGDSPGIIVKAWDSILTRLGNDLPDCSKQTDFNSANCPR